MMKSFLFLSVFSLILLSCDTVDNPSVPGSELDFSLFPGDQSEYPWPSFEPQAQSDITLNVMLEDFTGHKCTPCYQAGILAKEIEDANADRVFVASMHASTTGLFQQTDATYPPDYTTEAGDTYVTEMLGFVGNPSGTINRRPTGVEDQVWHGSSAWAMAVDDELSETPTIGLQMKFNYYPETNGLFVHTETEFLEDLDGQLNLINYLIRKNVVSPQSTPFGTNPFYSHHNVLSDAIGPVWGTNVSNGNTSGGDMIYNDFSYELPDATADSSYAASNLSVFTYVVNRETFRVLQVIKTDLE